MTAVLRRTAQVTNLVGPVVVLVATVARAQAPVPSPTDPLAAARAVFVEALREEDAGQFDEALGKFERVRAVRDTPSVEYRIGSCYEGLGKAALAFRAYVSAQTLGRGDAQSADVSRAASDRLDALAKQVARLTLLMPSPAPINAEVRVDDSVVSPALGSFALAPGHHVVSATADGVIPFRAETVLAGGEQVSVTVVLTSKAAPTETSATAGGRSSPWGWLAIGGGGVLAAASAFLLVERHDDVAELNRACPGGLCPPSADPSGLESTRSRALVLGPAGVACGIAGIALAAVGVYWVIRTHPSEGNGLTVTVAPMIGRGDAGLAFAGALR